MANTCVEKLKHDPNNVPAREKLARIFAERLHKPDLGIEQLTLLLNMPDLEAARRAEWLGLIAAWHIKHLQIPASKLSNACSRNSRTLPRLLLPSAAANCSICRLGAEIENHCQTTHPRLP